MKIAKTMWLLVFAPSFPFFFIFKFKLYFFKVTATEAILEVKAAESVDGGPPATESTVKPPPFKDHTFQVSAWGKDEYKMISGCWSLLVICLVTSCWQHSGIGGAAAGKKNRTWKNLKQLLVLERALPWKLDDPNCKFSCFYFFCTVPFILSY